MKFVTILLLSYVLVFCPQGMWTLSFPTVIESKPPALEGKILPTGHNCISVKENN